MLTYAHTYDVVYCIVVKSSFKGRGEFLIHLLQCFRITHCNVVLVFIALFSQWVDGVLTDGLHTYQMYLETCYK